MNLNMRVQYDELTVADDQSMAWQGEPFTGVAYETNSAGRVISEAGYVDGLQRGLAREWYDSGQLRSESHYEHGSKHGMSRSWYDNGQLESEAEYKYSIKVRERTWNRDGTLVRDWHLPENDEQRVLIDLLAKRFGKD